MAKLFTIKRPNNKLTKCCYKNKITKSEGIDETEGQECIRITNLKPRQCYCCLYYFFITSNFKCDLHLCNHCHHCISREKASNSVLFRIITTKRDKFRTISNMSISKLLT